MKIKNLTPEVQKLVVREITGDKKIYDLYVIPHGTTDIERMTIIEPKDMSGIFEIEGVRIPCITSDIPTDTETPDDAENHEVNGDVENTADPANSEVDAVKSEDEDPAPTSDGQDTGETFICDICGSEFGSARGLASHKSRTHPDN